MRLLPLSNDFVFKAVFAKNPDLLTDLLNSFAEFSGAKRIRHLKVLNPELPKKFHKDKLSILDIRAEDISGVQFLIEMQASSSAFFGERVLYYWSKFFSGSLKEGAPYSDLPKVYSFNFINFNLFPEYPKIHSVFRIKEEDSLEIFLTEKFEIHIIEMKKLLGKIETLESELDIWICLLRDIQNLKETDLKTLEKKNPKIKKAVSELRNISRSPKAQALYEERIKAEHDYSSGIAYAFEKGKEEGEQVGLGKGEQIGSVNALKESIQIALETKFGQKSKSIFTKVIAIQDIPTLQKILKAVIKEESLEKIKKLLA